MWRLAIAMLVLGGCGDGGRSAPAAKAVDAAVVSMDAGVDGLTDEQRNEIALEAFMAADRLATDTRRILLDLQAQQPVEERVVFEWLAAVRDGGDYDAEFFTAEELQLVDRFASMNPRIETQRVAGGVRVFTKDHLDDPEMKSMTIDFTVGRDADGELVVTHAWVEAPHAHLMCGTEDE